MAQYISKDTLVAEIERQLKLFGSKDYKCSDRLTVEERLFTLNSIKEFINTIEVKEVDLDCEVEKCLKRHQMLAVGKKDFTEIAKHFFELGLKAQKGE